MSVPDLAPRSGIGSVVVVWVVAAVVGLAVAIFAPAQWRAAWMPVGMGGCLILAFAIQLAHGHAQGFIQRVAASVLGALVVLGVIGIALALASLFAG